MHATEVEYTTAQADVCVVGLGYVGLTLAAALAEAGQRVVGYEANERVAGMLSTGQSHFQEHGIDEMLQRHAGQSLSVTSQLPQPLPATVVICVGTPLDAETKQPDLHYLEAAVAAIAEQLTDETLVIVRSTVPVGTSRKLVLPVLQQRVAEPLLAFAPERTIQGMALAELRALPQIVGGLNAAATERARALFAALTTEVNVVSSLEAAEMIKLICNAHTDLIYGFGNEVALIAEALGLDAYEMINAANLNYPRPDLSKPGFVGGSCLVKDPYLLVASAETGGYFPAMVAAARQLNESVPQRVAERVLTTLRQQGRDPATATILISGFAYKGQPETDDVRGSAVQPILSCFKGQVGQLLGHDFVVADAQIAAHGVEPVSLADGFAQADAVVILNNHRLYQTHALDRLTAEHAPVVLYDTWGVFADQADTQPSTMQYVRLGHG